MPALRSLLDAARWARVLSLFCGVLVAVPTIAAPLAVPPPAESRLFSPDPQAGGFFGYSSGVDGNAMVIGAFLQDGASAQSGAAYLFERDGTRWTRRAKLVAPDGNPFDFFGTSAAISGDTVVLGASNVTDTSGRVSGAAYVFRRRDGQWRFEAKLLAGDPQDESDFAFDLGVAVSGDTIAVAAGRASNGASAAAGAVYVYTRAAGQWTQTARIANPLPGPFFTGFGSSVSLGASTLVVGATFAPAGSVPAAGAAYVFRLQQGSWILDATLQASDPATFRLFGWSTAIDKDVIAVGALRGTNDLNVLSGAAYVFERKGSAWLQTARLSPDDGRSGDEYGYRITVGGDWVVVGADVHANAAGDPVGAAYGYRRVGAAWQPQFEIFPSDGQPFGEFSCSLATDGKILVVGAGSQAGSAGASVGEAYVYRLVSDR